MKTKKELEEENKFLWYYFQDVEEETEFMEVKQYDKKGELIAMSSSVFPHKKYRPKFKGLTDYSPPRKRKK